MKSFGMPTNGDWRKIIQAQASTSKQEQEEEKAHRLETRKHYKQELDSQLSYKHKRALSMREDVSHEQSFLRAQVKAISDFERSQKEEDRRIQKILAEDYTQENLRKVAHQREVREQEKQEERLRIQELQEKEKTEKILQRKRREEAIQAQQLALSQSLNEKRIRVLHLNREKDKDKEMIKQNIAKQAASENSFREFYAQRQAKQEEKLKAFQPVLGNEQAKWDAINKANRDYQIQLEEKIKLKEKEETDRINRNKELVQTELAKQVQDKRRRRKLDFLESIKEQNNAKIEDEKLRKEKALEIESKLQKKNDLKYALDSQIKQKQMFNNHQMDEREKYLNKSLFDQIKQTDKVSFLGVPGVSSNHHKQFVHHNKPYTLGFLRSQHYSPIREKLDFQKEMGVSPISDRKATIDPTKHNPIINPIGATLPRIIPGHHLKGSMSFAN